MKSRVLCILLGLPACASREWVRDYDGHVPWANPESVYAVMVVDAATGRPLEGVSVRLHREDIRPAALPGELVHEARTDEFGVVSFPWLDRYGGCHFVFDHPGYAPEDELGGGGDWSEIRLHPGEEWRGQLLDPQGGPAKGVTVELFAGCPHSPTVRTATTDAEGRFVLRDVAIDAQWTLWAPAPGAAADYWSGRFLPVPGHVLEPMQPPPGVDVTGTAYDAKGQPAPGVVVYSTQLDRGPKTVTRADGTFTLEGVEPGATIRVGPPGARARIRRTKPAAAPPPRTPPPSNTVRVRPPDAGYVEFWIAHDQWVEPEGLSVVELTTTLRGPVVLSFTHEEHGRGEIVVDVNASVVEVGPEAFPAPGVVEVLEPDGTPATGFSIRTFDGEEDDCPDGPRVSGWHYREGTRVRLGREDHATVDRVLEGKSPFVLRLGGASLEIDTGDAPFPVCWVDGQGFGTHLTWDDRVTGRALAADDDRGPIVVRGLDAGPHVVLVGALGRRAKALRVVLKEGEARRIELRLDPRPP